MTEPAPEHSHGGMGNPFSTKIGKLPIFVWAIMVVGVGGVVYYVYKKRSSGSTSASLPASSATTDSTTGISSDPWSSNDPFNSGATVDNSTTPTPSNAQWGITAENGLIASGQDPTTVTDAIAAYLGGNPLTVAEAAIVRMALSEFGTPPEGVIPITLVPAPSTPPATPHPSPTPSPKKPAPHPAPTPPKKPAAAPKPHTGAAHSYVVQPGDSLSKIAAKFYGNASDWPKIYDANRSVIGSNPNLIKPGEHLTIPA